MKIEPYALPDNELLEDRSSKFRVMVWEPLELCVVLGQSNQLEASVKIEHTIKDGIKIYKRPSGGEAVVLSPKTVVISILKKEERMISPYQYFNRYSTGIMKTLKRLGVCNLSLQGISDICIGNKKILGSSIYRNKNIVFYHAVLNRAEKVEVFERYLKHPKREPLYRNGRSHRDFVISLAQLEYHLTAEELKKKLAAELLKKY